jgi:hypothetical protein
LLVCFEAESEDVVFDSPLVEEDSEEDEDDEDEESDDDEDESLESEPLLPERSSSRWRRLVP